MESASQYLVMNFWHKVRERPPDLYICLALLLAIFATYAQVRHFAFINYDDTAFVTNNPHVRTGISVENLRWALTSGETFNWFPLTRISEMLDGQVFGLRSGWHHLENVVWHALATLFLFAFLRRATRAPGRSALVAFLFALHPLHVESVAWVAERKDVLGAFFWFLTLWAYVWYTERPLTIRYLLVLLCFCLGLMSKPMVVSLPFVLMLLDVWPLRRCSPKTPRLKEKIPFFVLSAAVSVTAFLAQRSGGSVQALTAIPLGLRIENALVSYVVYIGKMLWPAGLAVFYPYPKELPIWQPILAAVAIAGISTLALRSLRQRPYFAVGWFWYVVTLLPVIGLVQVGDQARADRYIYLPMAGLLIALAWGLHDVTIALAASRGRKSAVILEYTTTAIAVAMCLAAAAVTWVQLGYWRNSESLFVHAIEVTGGSYLAHYNLGMALEKTPSRLPQAIAEYESALLMKPDSPEIFNNFGIALAKVPGRLPEAIAAYRAALRFQPEFPMALNNLGNALMEIPGHAMEAIGEFEAALRIWPDNAGLHYNLANALLGIGQAPEAIAEYQAALRLRPNFAEAHNNLGMALANVEGRLPQAIQEFEAALRIQPGYAEARHNLDEARLKLSGRVK